MTGIVHYSYGTHSEAVNRGIYVLVLPLGPILEFSVLTMAGLMRRIQDCRNYLKNKEAMEGLYICVSGGTFCKFFEVKNEEN